MSDDIEAARQRLRAWVEQWVSDYYDPVIDPDTHDDLRLVLGMAPEIRHEQRDDVCVGCEQFGEPVEWLLAEARGHSDERRD